MYSDDQIALRMLVPRREDPDLMRYIRVWPNDDNRWIAIQDALGAANKTTWRSYRCGTAVIIGFDVSRREDGTRIVITTILKKTDAIWVDGKRYTPFARFDFNDLELGDVWQPEHLRN